MSGGTPLRSLSGNVGFALAASIVVTAAIAALEPILPWPVVVRLVVAALGCGCLLHAARRRPERAGAPFAFVLFLGGTGLGWLLAPTDASFVAVALVLLWLARALIVCPSLRDAAADLGFFATGVAAAVWTIAHSGSTGLAVWCLLLALALGNCLPVTGPGRPDRTAIAAREFDESLRAAERALARLAARRH